MRVGTSLAVGQQRNRLGGAPAGTAEITEVGCGHDVAGSLHDKTFTIHDASGARTVRMNCGAKKEQTELNFTGGFVSGSVFATAGAGKYIALSNATDRIVFWGNTGGESQPSVDGATLYVEVAVDGGGNEEATGQAFYDAITASLFAGVSFGGGNSIVEDLTTGVRVDATTDAGVGINVVAQGRDAATGGIVADIEENDIATDVAAAIAAIANGDGWAVAAVVEVVTFTDSATGARTDAADVDTGFSFNVTQQGS